GQVRQVVHDDQVGVLAENFSVSINFVEHVLVGDVRRVIHPHVTGLGGDRRLNTFIVAVSNQLLNVRQLVTSSDSTSTLSERAGIRISTEIQGAGNIPVVVTAVRKRLSEQ